MPKRRKRKKSGIPGVSFSWKRATGVTRAKQRIARKTGIPLTKAGRQRKIGRMVKGKGCLVNVLAISAVVLLAVFALVVILL